MTRSAGMPTRSATAWAVASPSPVISQLSRPASARRRIASAASGLTGSAIATTPATAPSIATQATLRPAPARRSASASSGVVSIPRSASSRPLPTSDALSVDAPLDAPSGQALERLDRPEPQLVALGPDDDRRPERMLARALERRREVEQRGRVDARRRLDGDDLRPARGQRAGLVEGDDRDVRRRLERLAAPEQDPGLGAAAGADHDRGRRREAHRAGAGDDDDADERGQRERQPRLRPEQPPARERGDREDHDRRHERLADAVGEPLDRRLAALGLLDEGDDPGQRRVGADARRPEQERPGRVDGRPDDLVAGTLRDRPRLAGQHRFVDRGRAGDDDPVDRHPSRRAGRGGRRRAGPRSTGTSRSSPPATSHAVSAWSPTRRRIAPTARPFARASSQRPSRTSPRMIVELSK